MTINEWDDYADEWDSNISTSVYADNAFRELNKIVKLEGQRVFDFGCGTGLLSERLSPHVQEIVALDGSAKMIDQLALKALPNVFPIAEFLTKNLIENNQLLRTKFDLIVASSVCAFLPDYEDSLSLIRSLLKPDGVYVQWDWLSADKNSEGGFTEEWVRQALSRANFNNMSLSQPFVMDSPPDSLTVLMAAAEG